MSHFVRQVSESDISWVIFHFSDCCIMGNFLHYCVHRNLNRCYAVDLNTVVFRTFFHCILLVYRNPTMQLASEMKNSD